MSTSVNPDGTTNGVSGKLAFGAPAGGLAAAVVFELFVEAQKYFPNLAAFIADVPTTVSVVLGVLVGVVTFVVGYLAKHAPAGLVEDIRAAVPTAANVANTAPVNSGSLNPPNAGGPPADR